MARLQILELPEGAGDDRPPFVLVVDQAMPERYILGVGEEPPLSEWERVGQQIGAQSVIVTPETIEIPANEVTLTDAMDGQVVRFRVEPDLTGFHEQVMEAVAKTKAHGVTLR